MTKAVLTQFPLSSQTALTPVILKIDIPDRYITYQNAVLLYFSLTVKAATLIFISGRGFAISSAKQGKSGSI